jgi:hypothetical protein
LQDVLLRSRKYSVAIRGAARLAMPARMRQMNAVVTYAVMRQCHQQKFSAQTLIVGICDACSRMPAQIFIVAVVDAARHGCKCYESRATFGRAASNKR